MQICGPSDVWRETKFPVFGRSMSFSFVNEGIFFSFAKQNLPVCCCVNALQHLLLRSASLFTNDCRVKSTTILSFGVDFGVLTKVVVSHFTAVWQSWFLIFSAFWLILWSSLNTHYHGSKEGSRSPYICVCYVIIRYYKFILTLFDSHIEC